MKPYGAKPAGKGGSKKPMAPSKGGGKKPMQKGK
jgi:hypothetical protein